MKRKHQHEKIRRQNHDAHVKDWYQRTPADELWDEIRGELDAMSIEEVFAIYDRLTLAKRLNS